MSMRIALYVAFSTTMISTTAFAGNTAVIGQTGFYNGAFTSQVSRSNNTSLTFQNGFANGALTTQTGRNNGAGISQYGIYNGAAVYQRSPAPSMP